MAHCQVLKGQPRQLCSHIARVEISLSLPGGGVAST